MNIEVTWDDDIPQTILMNFQSGWDWTQYYQAIDAAIELVQSQDGKAYILIDTEGAGNLPPSALTHLKKMAELFLPPIALVVMMGDNQFYKVMFNLAQKVTGAEGQKYVWADNRQEAAEHILAMQAD